MLKYVRNLEIFKPIYQTPTFNGLWNFFKFHVGKNGSIWTVFQRDGRQFPHRTRTLNDRFIFNALMKIYIRKLFFQIS